jgi:hypothetical protein
MKTSTQIIWPVAVMAVLLVTASCASTSRTRVNGQDNQARRGGVHVPMHVRAPDGASRPASIAASTGEPAVDYHGADMSSTSQHLRFQPESVNPPNRYCYIDAMGCPPRPGGPRR